MFWRQGLAEKQLDKMQVQILQAAMLNSHVGAFDYVQTNQMAKSTEFVAQVLGSFMQGLGQFVDDGYTAGDTRRSKELFRERLSAQIHKLTGQKPRWEVQKDGRYAIYQE